MVSSNRIIFAHISRHNLDEISVWVARTPCYHLWGLLPSKNVTVLKNKNKKKTHKFSNPYTTPSSGGPGNPLACFHLFRVTVESHPSGCNQHPIFFPCMRNGSYASSCLHFHSFIFVHDRATGCCILFIRCVLDMVTGRFGLDRFVCQSY